MPNASNAGGGKTSIPLDGIKMHTVAIILAAGFSSRMAPLFKPLLPLPLPWGNESAVASLCRRYRAEGVLPLVVGGNNAGKTNREASAAGGCFVLNPRPEDGMFSSILAGIASLPAGCTHFFIHPSDIPLVRRLTIRLLLDNAARHDAVLIPSFRGKTGHPPLFPARIKDILAGQKWKGGLREAMSCMRCQAIPTADAFMLLDMDTQDDYQNIRRHSVLMDILTAEEALELLNIMNIPLKGKEHALAVGAVAEAFAAGAGSNLSPSMARAGGIVHDLCKGQKNHEEAAGSFFRVRGLDRTAWLVESHRDICLPQDAPFTEREAVFLADKFVYGKRFIPIRERFKQKQLLYANDTNACEAIQRRLSHALEILVRFEKESGKNAEELARQTLSSPPFLKSLSVLAPDNGTRE